MSVLCPQCSKKTDNEYTCNYCTFEIKKSPVPITDTKTLSIELKSTPFILTITFFLTLSLSFIMYY